MITRKAFLSNVVSHGRYRGFDFFILEIYGFSQGDPIRAGCIRLNSGYEWVLNYDFLNSTFSYDVEELGIIVGFEHTPEPERETISLIKIEIGCLHLIDQIKKWELKNSH